MTRARNRRQRASGEREVYKLINVKLGRGEVFRRKQAQGSCDSDGDRVIALTVRRSEPLKLNEWITQARKQAKTGQFPVLAYRRNGEPWTFLTICDLDKFASLFELLEGT